MKQLIINGKPVKSIWKTNKPDAEASANKDIRTQNKTNKKHKDGKRAIPFIPESYADPTATAAIRNILREQEHEQRRKKHHIRS